MNETNKARIEVHVTGNNGYVWDMKSIKTLREKYHIVGAFIGSLPRLPQQNTFFGLPLVLMPEEVTLLINREIIQLVKASELIKHHETFLQGSSSSPEFLKMTSLWNFPATSEERRRCIAFEALWAKGFYVTSGPKFGGSYLVYPDDPLRYHSHYVVSVTADDYVFRPLDLISVGRLGTAVKKIHLLCAVEDLEEGSLDKNRSITNAQFFSVEWAGF